MNILTQTQPSVKHHETEIKGNRQPHVVRRTTRWMNDRLEDARRALNGEFGDYPDLAQHYIDSYLRMVATNHINGEQGSLIEVPA